MQRSSPRWNPLGPGLWAAGIALAAGFAAACAPRSEGGVTVEWEIRTVALALSLPGAALARALTGGADFFTLPSLLLGFLANLAAYTGLAAGLRGVLREPPRPAPEGHPVQVSRRGFLVGAAVLVGAAATRSAETDSRSLVVVRHPLPLRGLPPSLDGLRVALLADLHSGPLNSREYLEEVVRQTNALRPDLVLLPGDFLMAGGSWKEAGEVLAGLRPAIASVATLGNHDHWEGTEQARRALAAAGLHLVDNSRVFLGADRRLHGRPTPGLTLAGVGDLWTDRVDLDAALGDAPEGPRILLCHNPDFAEEPAARASRHRVDLMVAGHTHGGQVRVPGLGTPFLPSRYGQRYAAGWVQGPRWPVYVTRGVGVVGFPLRMGVRPELTLFRLASVP